MDVYNVSILLLIVAAAFQATEGGACAGCPVQQDPSTFDTGKLERALATANVNDHINKIVSVTTQVVAGLKYIVVYESSTGKTCTAIWFEQPWENKDPLSPQISCRAKRSIPGDYRNVDESEYEIMKQFGELAANRDRNGYRKIALKVLGAKKQVVHGMNYKIKFLVKTTACSMDQVPDDSCLNKETAAREICDALINTSPYLTLGSPRMKVIHFDCQKAKSDLVSFLHKLGNQVNDSINEDTQEMAMFATDRVNMMTNSANLYKLYKIKEVKTQVVAGKKYYITIVLRKTDCIKGNIPVSQMNCNFADNTIAHDIECKVTVLSQPWLNFKKVVSSQCSNVKPEH